MASKITKEVRSAAFIEKSRKERIKRQNILATQIQDDMRRLFQTGEFADITLTSGLDRYEAHLPLIQARLPNLYAACCSSGPQNDLGEHQEFDMRKTGVSPDDVHNFVELLYTSDDIISRWKEVQSTLIKSQATQSENTDLENNHNETCQISSSDKSLEEVEENPQNSENAVQKDDTSAQEDDMTTNIEIAMETGLRKTDSSLNEPTQLESSLVQNGHCDQTGVADDSPSHPETSVTETNGWVLPDRCDLPEAASPLGRDLLNMFVSGCGHDVKIKVDDKEIPAHKFILCSRSEYFTAMLGGSWRESSSAEINLEGVSYNAVLTTLFYIYGGSIDIDEDIPLREVVYLADMCCLEGLKEVAAFKLRQDYCHFFHKPCKGCLAGIAEVIMLSDGYRITELYEACVRWILKYLDRVWNHRSFASIPAELIRKCSQFAINELTPQTAIDTVTLVDKLVQSLPRVRWAEPIHSEARWLLDECIWYVVSHFLQIITEPKFDMLLVGLGWNEDLLDPLFSRVVDSLTIDAGCPTYLAVHNLKQRSTEGDWNEDALLLVNQLVDRCHSYLVTNVNNIIHTTGWQYIPEELRNKIKEDAVFVDPTKKVLAPRPVLSSSQKVPAARRTSNSSSSGRGTSRSAGSQRSAQAKRTTKS